MVWVATLLPDGVTHEHIEHLHILNDIAHYGRESKDQTYEFLLDSMDRYIDMQCLEYRRIQDNEHKGGRGSLDHQEE